MNNNIIKKLIKYLAKCVIIKNINKFKTFIKNLYKIKNNKNLTKFDNIKKLISIKIFKKP